MTFFFAYLKAYIFLSLRRRSCISIALAMLMTTLLSARRRGPQPGQGGQWQLPPRPSKNLDKALLCLCRPAAGSGSVWFQHTTHPLGLGDRPQPTFYYPLPWNALWANEYSN